MMDFAGNEFLARMDLVGYVFMALGVAMFNKYFSTWSYRSLFYFTQTLLVFVNMLDLLWVKRFNVIMGIPDTWFM